MKTFYSLLFLFAFSIVKSIPISFTDTEFKNYLLSASLTNMIAFNSNGDPIVLDADNSGEIDESEALMVYYLQIDGMSLLPQITDITEISYFTNLKKLKCINTDISKVNTSMLYNLEELTLSDNALINSTDPIDPTYNNIILYDPTYPNNYKLRMLCLDRNHITSSHFLTHLDGGLTTTKLKYLKHIFFNGNHPQNNPNDFTSLKTFKFDVELLPINSAGLYIPNLNDIVIDLGNNNDLTEVFFPMFDSTNDPQSGYYLSTDNTKDSFINNTNSYSIQGNIIKGWSMVGSSLLEFPYYSTEYKIIRYAQHCTNEADYMYPILYGNYNLPIEEFYTYGSYLIGYSIEYYGYSDPTPTILPTFVLARDINIIYGNYDIDGVSTNINPGNPNGLGTKDLRLFGNSVLQHVDFSNTTVQQLHFVNCPNLQTITHKDPDFTSNNGIYANGLYVSGTPSLQTVCVEDAVYALNNTNFSQPGSQNNFFEYTMGPYCSTYYYGQTLGGNIFYNNGYTYKVPRKLIKFNRSGSTNSYYSVTNDYYLKAFDDTYTITPLANLNSNFQLDFASKTQIVNYTNLHYVNDFTITKTNTVNDLSVSLFHTSNAVQNETLGVLVNIENIGTEINQGTVTVTFDDTRLTYINDGDPNISVSGNTITITTPNINPFYWYNKGLRFTVGIPPNVLVGDVISASSTLTNSTDPTDTNTNNSAATSTVVVGAYDPNDKICFEGDVIYEDQLDEFLTYRIRFQNDGNWYARNIVVTDEIDEKLDMDTFELVASKHEPIEVRSNPDNPRKLEFVFRNINLNWSNQNLEESQGYIIYKIKPAASTAIGDVISNTAHIFFDYEDAVITNTTQTTVSQNLSVEDLNNTELVSLYPNPTTSTLNISIETAIKQTEIYDALGRIVIIQLGDDKSVDVRQLKSGNYFIKIMDVNGNQMTAQFLKK